MSVGTHGNTSVLVLGGAGFIGRHVCAELARQGHAVRSLGRSPHTSTSDVVHVAASMSDKAAVDQELARAEVVVGLAASSLPATSNTDIAAEVNQHVLQTVQFAERCAQSGVEHFVFASSGGTVYGNSSGPLIDENTTPEPINAYGASKLAIEHYLRVLSLNSELSTLSLRISNPYGPGQRAARQQGLIAVAVERALSGAPITIWGNGTATRDFVHVGDVARAFAHAIGYRGKQRTINVGSGLATELNTVLRLVEAATDSKIHVQRETERACDVRHNSLSIDRANSELNWYPEISLENGIAHYVNELCSPSIDLVRTEESQTTASEVDSISVVVDT